MDRSPCHPDNVRERRKYTGKLNSEALKIVIKPRMSQQEVADLLGIPKGTMGNWVVTAKNGMPQIRWLSNLLNQNFKTTKPGTIYGTAIIFRTWEQARNEYRNGSRFSTTGFVGTQQLKNIPL